VSRTLQDVPYNVAAHDNPPNSDATCYGPKPMLKASSEGAPGPVEEAQSEPTESLQRHPTWDPRRLFDDSARAVALLTSALLTVNAVRFAWLSDDAFISFRAIANLVSGHGLVFNPGERVLGFTNPLWTLLLTIPFAITKDIYGVTMVSSLTCVLGLTVLLWRFYGGRWRAAWVLSILATSYTFVAFSTSGLENPLSHLLLGALFVLSLRRNGEMFWLFLIGGLVVLNRMDHALIVGPMLIAVSLRGSGLAWNKICLALVPMAAWLIFATIYYGFPYPNTAYAKLNIGIGRSSVIAQGLGYLVDSLLTDTLVVPLIGLAICAALAARKRHPILALWGAGIGLYMIYVCWIGGDFMSGRFLAAPFLVGVLLLAELLSNRIVASGAVVLVAVLAGDRVLGYLPSDSAPTCGVPPSGIVDERSCYVEHTGIAQNVRTKKFQSHPYFVEGRQLAANNAKVHVINGIGMLGFGAGPTVHILDTDALTDPLLARTKFNPQGNWRPGHLGRPLPEFYVESITQQRNLLKQPCAHALLDDLWKITKGPLFSLPRWRAILRRNLGANTCPG
jgi:arabinofuranosyltransferase